MTTDVNDGNRLGATADSSSADENQSAAQGQAPSAGTQNTDASQETVPYSRFKEVIDEKNALKSQLEQQQSQVGGYSQLSYSPSPSPMGYTQVQSPQSVAHDSLVEQLGYEGADSVRKYIQNQVVVPILQQQYVAEYNRLYNEGASKYGDQWSKFDYVNQHGVKSNRIVDVLASSPALTLEEAWNAKNPVNPAEIAQRAKDEAYAEMQNKQEGTAAQGGTVSPSSSGEGHANTFEEAFKMAYEELSK